MKPRILLSGVDGSRENYERAVAAAGGEVCSFYCPQSNGLEYDGLLLCGGWDVEPSCYHQKDCGQCRKIDLDRDRCEIALVKQFQATGRPILGICRGIQVINVALGGSLTQDIPAGPITHQQPEGDVAHPTRAAEESLLHRLYGAEFAVNSDHHQAIDRLAEGLIAVQWTADGLIEGIQSREGHIYGVQWHPERMTLDFARPDTVDGMKLIQYFVDLCGLRSGLCEALCGW